MNYRGIISLTPFLFPLSNKVKEGEQLYEKPFASSLSFEKERGKM